MISPPWSSSLVKLPVTWNADSTRRDSVPHGSGASPTAPAAPPAAPANATDGRLPFRSRSVPKRRSLNVAPSGAEMIRSFMHTRPAGSSSRSPRTCGASWLQAPYLIPQNNNIINRNRRPAKLATILELVGLAPRGSCDCSPAAAPPTGGRASHTKRALQLSCAAAILAPRTQAELRGSGTFWGSTPACFCFLSHRLL